MVLPPKTLAWRLLLWSALLVWAVYKLRDTAVEDVFVAPPPPTVELVRPADAPAPVGEPADVVDVEAAVRAMDAFAAGAVACGAEGTLAIELGVDGLAQASLTGTGDTACVARAAWSAPWPRTRLAFELERAVP